MGKLHTFTSPMESLKKKNTMELNYSFYRFPTIKSVLLWKASGKDMSWSVKMNRIVIYVVIG